METKTHSQTPDIADGTCSRRQVLGTTIWLMGSFPLAVVGCATSSQCPAPSRPDERPLRSPPRLPRPIEPAALNEADVRVLRAHAGAMPIVTRQPNDAGVLRRLAHPLGVADREHLALLEQRMRDTLSATKGGVGLAAPQVGLGARAILVMLDARGQSPHVELFVNPRIVQRSDDVTLDYEGCLSIPDVCGLVRRNRAVVVEHDRRDGTPGRIEATEFDARIFQHEVDHLDGVLYVDRVEGGIQPRERLKELREKLRQEQPTAACTPVILGRRRDEVVL